MASLLLPISPDDDAAQLMSAGTRIARNLDYQLIPFTYNKSEKEVRNPLVHASVTVQHSDKNFFHTIYSFLNSTEHDVTLVVLTPKVINLKSRNKATHFFAKFRSLKVPYLVLPDAPDSGWCPENIFFPVCLQDGEKEASAWAGFWTRTHQGRLHIIHPEFRNKTTKQYLQRNLAFIRNLFNQSNVVFETCPAGCKRKEARSKAIEMAGNSRDSLLVLPATRLNSPEYVFTGPPEIRLLKNRGNTPVLFVNPLHDLYVPCG
ncbi:hypothetical protein [Marinilabilia sp.]|uniref:hypothetical protein n=1 Tax=Marinilabilia sp. TaxID=2021252 RepID=UPI0025C16614|nr:hypothetical protein [Marinilabilia sp.]